MFIWGASNKNVVLIATNKIALLISLSEIQVIIWYSRSKDSEILKY
jgi:hypothetical protein